MTTQTKATSKYTPEMEQAMRDAGTLNQAKAAGLAAQFGFTTRSVIAKAVRMGLPYERKQPTTKDGSPVEHKDALVAEIAEFVGASLEGLEKAPKPALQRLRDYLAA